MKILYLSCHEVLEFYELSLLYELGHEVISIGEYNDPRNPRLSTRPAIDQNQQELAKIVSHIPICSDLKHIDERLIKWADIIWIMHRPDWLETVLGRVRNKPVILRTIGQNIAHHEHLINQYKSTHSNFKVVRYSPYEVFVPHFKHMDVLIRFYTDEDVYKGWLGNIDKGLIVSQNILQRSSQTNGSFLLEAAKSIDIDIYGRMNGDSIKELSFNEYIAALKAYKFILIAGTIPASYTLTFIEALMSGIPVIALGPALGDGHMLGQSTYEVPTIIQSGVNGFIVDSIPELISARAQLSSKNEKFISMEGRKTALELFSKQSIKKQWQEFLCYL